MGYEWDPAKSLKNLAKHGIPLDIVELIFEGPVLARRRDRRGEERWLAVGSLEGLIVAIAYTKSARAGSGSSAPGGRTDMSAKPTLKSRARAVARKLRDAPDETIDYGDIPPLRADFFKTAELLMPAGKDEVSLRLDRDVLEFFRRGGKEYQSRINAVLRAYMIHVAERQS